MDGRLIDVQLRMPGRPVIIKTEMDFMGKEGGKQMRINEIIRERRLAENLTQEQVALRLGVTAPAVNKWEKGVSHS